MTFLHSAQSLLQTKQEALDFQDLQGLWRISWQIGGKTLFCGFYTRIDQVFILWGLITATIFITAQFLTVSWSQQAIFWSVLTLMGTVAMVVLTHFWVRVERLVWVLYKWVILMLGGVIITDLSIVLGWGEVLIRLCPLWLGLSAFGYIGTGIGLRSRALIKAGLVHGLGIAILPYVGAWQFLATGLVMACSLLLLAELQWDMRRPIDYAVLTPQQKQFNQQQHQKRQLSL
jgi:hypothetical protein